MAEVEGNGARLSEAEKSRERRQIAQRGNRLQMRLARVELAMDGLIAVDRLLVLNQALTNVLYDDAGGR